MYLYFVDDSNKAYYQSPMFGKIINFMQQNARRCHIRENNNRRSISIEQVTTVENAVDILTTIHAMETI